MTVNQRKRPRLTEAEQKCLKALTALQKEYGDERPPVAEIGKRIGTIHTGTVSQLLKSLSLKGYVKETFEVFA
jgi:Mn-dependent DtxR family transcriptional regulator